ncbi:MAG: hypothetical protein WDW38_009815 [Sanguina aurantia]
MREYSRFHTSDDGHEDEASAAADEAPLLGANAGNSNSLAAHGASLLTAWTSLFKKGNDFESARVNHQFTAEEREKLCNVESIDYLAPNSAMYRKWLARQPHRRYWDRWAMMGAIGVTMGLLAHLLYMVIHALATFKYGVTRWLIGHTNMGLAWLFNTVVSTSLVAAASWLVVGFAPEAVGSGIPEVIAYLNGCALPKVFNIVTLMVKFASCGLAVASGLPVGPEGPLIHIGAGLGSALSQGHSTTLGFSTGLFKRFRNPKDKRDFVTAGVSVGVATAFNAPIGGLLFAFEEVASFWQQSLGWQVFFSCMCAVLTMNLSKSATKALLGQGHFGWFDKDVAFEVGFSFSSHILAVFPAALIGAVAGLLAIVFTAFSIKVARLRDSIVFDFRWGRCIEPCVLTVLYITGCMVLPLFFPCTPTECLFDQNGEMQCQTGLSGLPTSGIIPDRAPSLPLYTCRVVEHPANGSWIPSAGGSILPDFYDNGNATTTTVYYNQLATLLFNTGEDSIKLLFARGTHRRFGYKALAVMGAYYTLGAAVFSGSAISSGLFVPMLMIGAILGRMIGLLTVDVAQSMGTSWDVDTFGPWTWIDPGAFALVGAGAFMGGVTRMTVALAVIIIEMSSDVHMLLPVLVAIMVAKWVADAVTHSLYHGMLEVKCVPFLRPEPVSKFSLDLVPVSYVMQCPVVTLRLKMTVKEVSRAIRGSTHNGFPVVRDTPLGEVCLGIVTRAHVLAVLQRIIIAGHSEGVEVGWDELDVKMMDPVLAQRLVVEQQMVALQSEMAGGAAGGLMGAYSGEFSATATTPTPSGGGGSGSGGGLFPTAAAKLGGGGSGLHAASGKGEGGMGALERLEDRGRGARIQGLIVDLTPYVNTSAFMPNRVVHYLLRKGRKVYV